MPNTVASPSRFEQAFDHLLRDTRACVVDLEHDSSPWDQFLRAEEVVAVGFRHLKRVGADADAPARAVHGFGGVLEQIDDDLPELLRVGVDFGQARSQLQLERDVGGDDTAHQLFQVHDQSVRVFPFESDLSLSGVSHQLVRECDTFGGGLTDGRNGRVFLLARTGLNPGQVEGVLDDRKHVVEVVRDAGGQVAEALDLLDLDEAALHLLASLAFAPLLRHIAQDHQGKERIHQADPGFEMPVGSVRLSAGQEHHLDFLRAESLRDGLAQRLAVAFREEGGGDRATGDQAGDGVDIVGLLVDGDEVSVGVENAQTVGHSRDQRALALFNLADVLRFARKRVEHAVYALCDEAELVLGWPLQIGAVAVQMVFADVSDLVRERGEGVQHDPRLQPENRQDKDNSD